MLRGWLALSEGGGGASGCMGTGSGPASLPPASLRPWAGGGWGAARQGRPGCPHRGRGWGEGQHGLRVRHAPRCWRAPPCPCAQRAHGVARVSGQPPKGAWVAGQRSAGSAAPRDPQALLWHQPHLVAPSLCNCWPCTPPPSWLPLLLLLLQPCRRPRKQRSRGGHWTERVIAPFRFGFKEFMPTLAKLGSAMTVRPPCPWPGWLLLYALVETRHALAMLGKGWRGPWRCIYPWGWGAYILGRFCRGARVARAQPAVLHEP